MSSMLTVGIFSVIVILFYCVDCVRVSTVPPTTPATNSSPTPSSPYSPRRLRGYYAARRLPDEDEPHYLSFLPQINEKITRLLTMEDESIRKIEALEYRLTKIEVSTQEKAEGIRSDLREVLRRFVEFEGDTTRFDTALDAVQTDTAYLKQALEQLRTSQTGQTPKIPGMDELSNNVKSISTSILGLRSSLAGLESNLERVKRDVSRINNDTSDILGVKNDLVTKNFLSRELIELSHTKESNHPTRTKITKGRSVVIAAAGPTAVEEYRELPQDCAQLRKDGQTTSGIYRIFPAQSTMSFFVYCDMTTLGGGWTVIQRRNKGVVMFQKDWQDYKHGFGNIADEFWLGLERIHILTNYKVAELYIQLEDFEAKSKKVFAHFDAFAVGSEIEHYPINILGKYNGTAGDALSYHAGSKFSTYDMDHDSWNEGNCARAHTGAWWYNACEHSNLNGLYLKGKTGEGSTYQGMYWSEFHGTAYSLKSVVMMIRPRKEL